MANPDQNSNPDQNYLKPIKTQKNGEPPKPSILPSMSMKPKDTAPASQTPNKKEELHEANCLRWFTAEGFRRHRKNGKCTFCVNGVKKERPPK